MIGEELAPQLRLLAIVVGSGLEIVGGIFVVWLQSILTLTRYEANARQYDCE